MAELPGNVHGKIGDLRIKKGLTKKQVSEDLGIPASQLTRIENEDIKSIGHELVIKFADYFGVSTDYLLGKTSVRAKKNVELDELGLSHKALVTLLSGKVNMQLLSRIIEHKYFISLMEYAEPSTDISGEEMREQIQKLHDEAIGQKKKLTEESMAGITTQMISSLGLSEENMQAFQELMVNILKDSINGIIGKR